MSELLVEGMRRDILRAHDERLKATHETHVEILKAHKEAALELAELRYQAELSARLSARLSDDRVQGDRFHVLERKLDFLAADRFPLV